MSSASSERYQSRLFNFVHKQSRRWSEGVGRTFRHLQVAANWSLEALAYPVFILLQKARESAGKQLQATGEQTQNPQIANYTDFQSEAPPASDIPIQQVLKVVENLQIISRLKTQDSRLKTQGFRITPHLDLSSNIQGIASQLCDRQLVLVTLENEILDILTPQQQQKLEEHIITEIANYWRQWRLSQVKEETTNVIGEINRLLTKLTGSNHKNTTPALLSPNTDQNPEELSLLNAKRSLALLDATVAKLESNALEPISHTSRELIQILQTQLQIFIYGKEQIATNQQTTATLDNSHNPTSKIQNLIWAAINFFFGESQSKKLDQARSKNQISSGFQINHHKKLFGKSHKLQKTSKMQSHELIDLWLSESDIFGDVQIIGKSLDNSNQTNPLVSNSPISNSVFPSNQTARYPLQTLIHRLQSFTLQSKERLVQKQNPVTDLTSTQTTFQKISIATQTVFAISQQQHQQTTEVEAKPDWIEIKAKTIGYDKHPLEQILGWLDSTMLWLEEMMVRIFKLLQRLWRGK
ncbi:MAG: hypothetical protein KME28_14935 [Pelatocladus maniniholoensis HA4357-MV3]|jgi:hypothetical protein|uniref:Uncharacterized protein n=1 Tax=Pelatocladus maniniholoensis HA4357-MV3 TaxID=1117104 RepID=A0A9E3HAD9_9NOST|nr:hypothetical protein [Pelatocladus maniniholoensis HA4357-MV3]BAZ66983.1 hypothetical protein NIES4106_17360 [Fischerella sp. NIES-4106]